MLIRSRPGSRFGADTHSSRCEAAPSAARRFPGPRERWGWTGKASSQGPGCTEPKRKRKAEEAGRKPVWGREGATPLGPLYAASAAHRGHCTKVRFVSAGLERAGNSGCEERVAATQWPEVPWGGLGAVFQT